jgi:hypothetical protein
VFGQANVDNLSKIMRHIYLKGDKNHKGQKIIKGPLRGIKNGVKI